MKGPGGLVALRVGSGRLSFEIMKNHTLALATFCILAASGTAAAQSFNIDISNLMGAPSASYGGAANQPGHWNVVDNSSHASLSDLNGQPTQVDIFCFFPGGDQGSTLPPIPGDVGTLVRDGKFVGWQSDTFGISVEGLLPGIYEVYTYCWMASGVPSSSPTELFMYHAVEQTKIAGAGAWPGDLLEGVTHTKHRATSVVDPLLPGTRLAISYGADMGPRHFTGLQVKYLGAPGDTYCTSTPNSTGQPAHLSTSGSVSVLKNDLVLHADPVPDGFGLFFYGPAEVQLPLADGFLCVGAGSVGHARLPATLSSGGVLTTSLDLTNPPFPAATIGVLGTWNFQAWFRDVAAGGTGANLSDARRFTFLP